MAYPSVFPLTLVGAMSYWPYGILILTALAASADADGPLLPIRAGETVVVMEQGAQLFRNDRIVARLDRGATFKVEKVQRDWVAGYVLIAGEKEAGWLKKSSVQTRLALDDSADFQESEIEPRPDQKEALKALARFRPGTDWDREGYIVSISLAFSILLTDRDLAVLQRMSRLRKLDLAGTRITDAGVARLTGLAELRELNVSGTRIRDAGLASLRAMKNLRKLNLMGTRVTDAGVASLEKLSRLSHLNLNGTRITDAALARLANMRQLRVLKLACPQLSKEAVARLQQKLPETEIQQSEAVQ